MPAAIDAEVARREAQGEFRLWGVSSPSCSWSVQDGPDDGKECGQNGEGKSDSDSLPDLEPNVGDPMLGDGPGELGAEVAEGSAANAGTLSANPEAADVAASINPLTTAPPMSAGRGEA